MRAYKLLRWRADGTLGPLFVGRDQVIRCGRTLTARDDLPHPGLAHRPGFHCTAKPYAPHIKMKLKNGESRVWCQVIIDDYSTHTRPQSQGGVWYVAKYITVTRILTEEDVKEINNG